MAISAFFKTPPYFSEDPAQAVRGELIEVVCGVTLTAAGFTSAAAGDIPLGDAIPKGNWRIRCDLSRIQCSAATATSDLDVGLAAYVKADGSSQALQGALLADSLDVGGGAVDVKPNSGVVIDVNSRDGIGLVCSFDTANSPTSGQRVLVNLVLQKLPLP